MTRPSRICLQVQEHLPHLVDGTLPALHQRLVRAHLRRCEDCAAELQRQEAVAAALRQVEAGAEATEPPEDLLEVILQRAQSPGLRERAAVPARGAVSGARPGLSLAFLLAAALVGTGLGMVLWRAGRALSEWVGRGPDRDGPSGTADP